MRVGSLFSGIGGFDLGLERAGMEVVWIPARVDRLRSLGNALVPQIAEWIGRQVMARG